MKGSCSQKLMRYLAQESTDTSTGTVVWLPRPLRVVLNQVWKGRDRGDAIWIGHLEC